MAEVGANRLHHPLSTGACVEHPGQLVGVLQLSEDGLPEAAPFFLSGDLVHQECADLTRVLGQCRYPQEATQLRLEVWWPRPLECEHGGGRPLDDLAEVLCELVPRV